MQLSQGAGDDACLHALAPQLTQQVHPEAPLILLTCTDECVVRDEAARQVA